jgi:hypothetical protein
MVRLDQGEAVIVCASQEFFSILAGTAGNAAREREQKDRRWTRNDLSETKSFPGIHVQNWNSDGDSACGPWTRSFVKPNEVSFHLLQFDLCPRMVEISVVSLAGTIVHVLLTACSLFEEIRLSPLIDAQKERRQQKTFFSRFKRKTWQLYLFPTS